MSLDDVTRMAQAFGDERFAAGIATGFASRDAEVVTLQKRIADLSSPWFKIYESKLSSDDGWVHTTGQRKNVDSSYNRKENTSFSSTGMLISVTKENGKWYSSDAMGKFLKLPNYFAIELDITLSGYFGPGCFPAFWFRPNGTGEGELDAWEFMGGRVNSTNAKDRALAWKTTVITTPYSSWKGLEKPLIFENPTGLHRWRYEKTMGKIELFCDGKSLAAITKDEFDNKNPGLWAKNFEVATHQWYPRLTYQFGPPADGTSYNAAGAIPPAANGSLMSASNLVAYGLKG